MNVVVLINLIFASSVMDQVLLLHSVTVKVTSKIVLENAVVLIKEMNVMNVKVQVSNGMKANVTVLMNMKIVKVFVVVQTVSMNVESVVQLVLLHHTVIVKNTLMVVMMYVTVVKN